MQRIHEILPDRLADRVALIDIDGTRLSYGDLIAQSADLADIYRDAGLRAGDRLILVAENSRYYVLAILAASRLDVWVTLINARQTAEELAALIDHSGARMVTFTHDASPNAAAHAARLGAVRIGAIAGQEVLATPARQVQIEPVQSGPDQIAALMYTTGTTSAPKGVMLSHGNLLACAERVAEVNGMGTDEEVLLVLPGTHIYALGSVLLSALGKGNRVRLLGRFDPQQVIACLRDGVTMFPGVPQMHAALLAWLRAEGQDRCDTRLRYMTSGGAPLDPALMEGVRQVFGVPLLNGYGLTETSPTVSVGRLSDPPSDTSVGPPLRDIKLRIRDADANGIGELEIQGPTVMQGYYRDPVRTAEALSPDGWFRSGDLARIGENGHLYIVGRVKELIIRSGFNVHPPEVEAMLTRHPLITQAAVIGRPVPGNEEICAFVIADPAMDPDQVKGWLHQHLSPYKIPQHILRVDAYPSAATGKILKHKLVKIFADQLPPAQG